jgi:hypothetical protein
VTSTTGIKNHGSRIDIKIIAPRMEESVDENIVRESERFSVAYNEPKIPCKKDLPMSLLSMLSISEKYIR